MKFTSFAVKNEENHAIYFCGHVNCAFPLICAGSSLSQRENSLEKTIEAILAGICPIKQCFCCN